MKNLKCIFIISAVIIFCMSVPLFARGAKDSEPQIIQVSPEAAVADTYGKIANGDTIKVSGRVRLVGSEPFSEMIITDRKGRDWHIAPESRGSLANKEQQTVRVRGRVEIKEMIMADGRLLGYRVILHDVRLL